MQYSTVTRTQIIFIRATHDTAHHFLDARLLLASRNSQHGQLITHTVTKLSTLFRQPPHSQFETPVHSEGGTNYDAYHALHGCLTPRAGHLKVTILRRAGLLFVCIG